MLLCQPEAQRILSNLGELTSLGVSLRGGEGGEERNIPLKGGHDITAGSLKGCIREKRFIERVSRKKG